MEIRAGQVLVHYVEHGTGRPVLVLHGAGVDHREAEACFELAFDGETARALHDEDLEVDTDFCAMCGHDWCSMRISKEIQAFASGKDPEFQPARRAAPSPGLGEAGRSVLRGRDRPLPVIDGRHACHSDHVPDAARARGVQDALLKS